MLEYMRVPLFTYFMETAHTSLGFFKILCICQLHVLCAGRPRSREQLACILREPVCLLELANPCE